MHTDQQAVIDFWFDAGDRPDHVIASRQAGLWWRHDPDNDARIGRRFGALVEQAARGRLNAWATTPSGVLALLLLTDQFRRNLYRGQAQAFAMDDLARGLTRQLLRVGGDRGLRPIHRVFVYLPLEHSESLADQDDAVALFTTLAASVPAEAGAAFAQYVDFARAHRDVIARYGRFPHRNAALGRINTPAERDYLATPGAGF